METEFSLLLLMLFSGMGVGASVLAAVAECADYAQKGDRYRPIARCGAYTALPALAIGLVASVFHLNKPLSFVNGIVNFSSSWISREGVFGILFLILAALYALAWFFTDRGKGIAPGQRIALAVLAAVAALCLVCSTGMAYAIVRPIPAWNTPLTVLFFGVSACLLGTLLVAAALVVVGKVVKAEARFELWTALQGLPKVAVVLLLALAVVEGLRLVHLSTASAEAAAMALSLLGGQHLGLTLMRWIVGLALPLLGLAYAWLGAKPKPEVVNGLVVASFVCVLAGEVVARMLFFLAGVHI